MNLRGIVASYHAENSKQIYKEVDTLRKLDQSCYDDLNSQVKQWDDSATSNLAEKSKEMNTQIDALKKIEQSHYDDLHKQIQDIYINICKSQIW